MFFPELFLIAEDQGHDAHNASVSFLSCIFGKRNRDDLTSPYPNSPRPVGICSSSSSFLEDSAPALGTTSNVVPNISLHGQDRLLILTCVFSSVPLHEVKTPNNSHRLGEDSSKHRKPPFNHHKSSLSCVHVVWRCFKLISKSPPSPGKTCKTATLMLVCKLKHCSDSKDWNGIYYWG